MQSISRVVLSGMVRRKSTPSITTFSTAAFIATSFVVTNSALATFNFSDITNWVGTGANESALVIDWQDGGDALAWGYRWDGSATGLDMLTAIETADPQLVLYFGDTDPINTGGDGTGGAGSIYGIGYDRDGDGFTLVPGAGDTGSAGDPDDSYAEGWFSNFWGYFVNIDNSEFNFPPPDFIPEPNPNFGTLLGDPYDGGSWGFSGLGAGDHQLFDGSWDGWGYNGSAPAQPVPEPAGVALIAIGMTALAGRRRRDHR